MYPPPPGFPADPAFWGHPGYFAMTSPIFPPPPMPNQMVAPAPHQQEMPPMTARTQTIMNALSSPVTESPNNYVNLSPESEGPKTQSDEDTLNTLLSKKPLVHEADSPSVDLSNAKRPRRSLANY